MDRACNARDRLLGCSLVRMNVLTALMVLVYWCATSHAAEDQKTEYRVKRAFVVNFLKFVEWPQAPEDETDQPFVIAVIGKLPLEEGSTHINDVQVNDRNVVMTVRHQWDPDSESQKKLIERCGALFITRSEEKSIEALLGAIKQRPVLTVGETADFLQRGGIINFEVDDNKVRFSINLKNAQKADLVIRSKLLRLAKHVEQD